ncbi:MAG: hypothetical protein GY805_10255 [Chloroflexi bacterium]|nr:hypothetical protein [Chloroflexota bacterium]
MHRFFVFSDNFSTERVVFPTNIAHQALNVRWLVASYPSISTHSGCSLINRYRDSMHQIIDGLNWPVTELLFEGELVFVIEKSGHRE